MTENDIKREIMATARAMGFIAIRVNAGKPRHNVYGAPNGTPDVLVLMPGGRSLWVETKMPGKGPTGVQADMHKRMRDMKHAVTVSRSVEEFVESVREVTEA